MNAKRRTLETEQLTVDEFQFWQRAFLRALPDCLSMERSPDYCSHIAADTADASVREYRTRASQVR